ncbi:MAG: hypothetical protein OEY14_19130, partial [Myxococcales bacterium]|nr:hypothetical protein [Myxococcales bacterium]
MGAYHLIQLLLGGVVVALVWRRCRALLYRAQLDAKPFQAAFLPAFEGGEFERLGSLISPARPAWLAEVGEAALDARMEGLPIGPILDEILLDLRFRSLEGLRALRIMVTLGSTSGLLGALLELRWL